jgi:hypothetical protein
MERYSADTPDRGEQAEELILEAVEVVDGAWVVMVWSTGAQICGSDAHPVLQSGVGLCVLAIFGLRSPGQIGRMSVSCVVWATRVSELRTNSDPAGSSSTSATPAGARSSTPASVSVAPAKRASATSCAIRVRDARRPWTKSWRDGRPGGAGARTSRRPGRDGIGTGCQPETRTPPLTRTGPGATHATPLSAGPSSSVCFSR